MLFILQKENDFDIEVLTLKLILDKQKFQHQYLITSLSELINFSYPFLKDAIPIGSLEFVSIFLEKQYHILKMNPIEVPSVLRINKFLNREYSIITKEEVLKKDGYAFLKYASKLKEFSYCGDINSFLTEHTLKDGLYVFSEYKVILSEYRVFVIDNTIQGIQFYDGYPTITLNDNNINKIKEMIVRLMIPNMPKAYSLDIAIIDNKEQKDIMILELHPFTSVGLYGFESFDLPYAYMQGFHWYVEYNLEISEYNNK